MEKSVRFSMEGHQFKYLGMVFLAASSENWQLEELPEFYFGCVPEKISFVGKDKVINWEFCILKITPIVVFVIILGIFYRKP